jgi:hypothetical protein
MPQQIFSKAVCERLRDLRTVTWVLFTNHRAWSYSEKDKDLAIIERDKASIAAIDYKIAAEKRIEELEATLQHLYANSSDTEKKLDHLERLVEGEGWMWMDAANCYTPHTATCHKCRDTRTEAIEPPRDPFASINDVSAERRERLADPYARHYVARN